MLKIKIKDKVKTEKIENLLKFSFNAINIIRKK